MLFKIKNSHTKVFKVLAFLFFSEKQNTRYLINLYIKSFNRIAMLFLFKNVHLCKSKTFGH